MVIATRRKSTERSRLQALVDLDGRHDQSAVHEATEGPSASVTVVVADARLVGAGTWCLLELHAPARAINANGRLI